VKVVTDLSTLTETDMSVRRIKVDIKPLTVNRAWQGKRFKTPEYKAYEQELLLKLPNDFKVPKDGHLVVKYEFGVSSRVDWDNPIKPFQDVLQKKYGFDDNRIIDGTVIKTIVKRGEEFARFWIKRVI